MVGDHKLRSVRSEPDNLTISYGSKDDDDRALNTLSELLATKHETQEFFASEIVGSLGNLPDVCFYLLFIQDCTRR